MGTLWHFRCRSTYIWALFPQNLIKIICFVSKMNTIATISNHKNFYGYKKMTMYIHFVQQLSKFSVTMLKCLILWVHYGKWSWKWLVSLHGCLVPMVVIMVVLCMTLCYTWWHKYNIHTMVFPLVYYTYGCEYYMCIIKALTK